MKHAFTAIPIGCCMGCGSPQAASSGDVPVPPAHTYVLDLSRADPIGYAGHQGERGPARFDNESMAFSLPTTERTRVITAMTASTGDPRKVYNRLPCQVPRDETDDDEMASQGFRSVSFGAAEPVSLESVTAEFAPDPVAQKEPVRETCFAYQTADGVWHGRWRPIATTFDPVARVARASFALGPERLTAFGLVVYTGYVSKVTYVTR